MLQHEQHMLPVDLLFDDERIGEFVKSIQIDSPYQQMLLQGVLTESVRDEILCVSFTVEGYFHYVLGEVINEVYYQKSLNSLANLMADKKLNGIEPAIEICLSSSIDKNIVTQCLILANKGLKVNVLVNPISNYFVRNVKMSDFDIKIEFIEVFLNQKSHPFTLLKLVLLRLRNLGHNEIIQIILKSFYNYLKLNLEISRNVKFQITEILLDFSSYFDHEECSELCQLAIDSTVKPSFRISSGFYSSLALSLKILNRPSEAQVYFEKVRTKNRLDPEKKIQALGRIANCYVDFSLKNNDVSAANKAIHHFKTIYKTLEKHPSIDPILKATLINNYAKTVFVFIMKKWKIKFSVNELKKLFEESYDLTIKHNGFYSDLTAKIFNNLSMFYAMTGDLNKSLQYSRQGFKIVEKVYPVYSNDRAIFAFNLGNRLEQIGDIHESNQYYQIAYDINLREGRILVNKNMSIAYARVLKKLSMNDLASQIESQISQR
jgi:tetratricopeptide (TPR) repeat protein